MDVITTDVEAALLQELRQECILGPINGPTNKGGWVWVEEDVAKSNVKAAVGKADSTEAKAIFDKNQVPSIHKLDRGFKPGCFISISGQNDLNAQKFAIDFKTTDKSDANIALHINPRFSSKVAVLNTYENGFWGPESRQSLSSLVPGKEFEIAIVCDTKEFKISLNDKLWCSYEHRISPEKIYYVHVRGVVNTSINYMPHLYTDKQFPIDFKTTDKSNANIALHTNPRFSSKSTLECEICFKSFNDSNRKPRNLACGHVYCNSCIDQSILHGSNICPACGTSLGTDSASDLPVNFYILKLVEDHPIEDVKQDKDSDDECDLVSIEEYLEEIKSDLIVETNTEIHRAKETYHDLQYYVKAKDNDLKKKSFQVQCLLLQIENETKMQDDAKNKIVEMEEIQTGLESLKIELSSATKKSDITISYENIKDKLRTAKKLEDHTDLNFIFSDQPLSESLLSERPKLFLTIFQKKPEIVHAYQQSGGVYHSAELSLKDGKIHLNALSKHNGQVPQNAVVVQASHLFNLAIPQCSLSSAEIQNLPLKVKQARPEVFLTLASDGNTLGTVYISVDPNAQYAKQFLELFIGSQGSSYKGINTFELLSNKCSKDITYGIASKYYMQKSESDEQTKVAVQPKFSLSTTHHYIDMDEDDCSEAKFQFKVKDLSQLNINGILMSGSFYVHNLAWKIRVMRRYAPNGYPRGQQAPTSMGFLLLCEGESRSTSWSCNIVAELRLLSVRNGQAPLTRKIKHLFCSNEQDWGFVHFMPWKDALNPEKGYIKDDTVTLEVWLLADTPKCVSWDSKKLTGYVGLKNQGTTCYMNSLLQVLYFTSQLRMAVYMMPTESDDTTKSVALALQQVFHELQMSNKPVRTKKFTKSLGWETLNSFMQHDAQLFLRVLLDKLETQMKGTCVEGSIPNLFEGKTVSYFKCKHAAYTSSRTETFYDIQLNIKGKNNIYDSLKEYISVESLDGDIKYGAGDKGVIFQSFPPVLHLHLMRFQYNPITCTHAKINDRYEFPDRLNLDQFLQKPDSDPATYILHAVLVHSGDIHGSHYVVFINPKGDGRWCKYDDDAVTLCSKQEAIDHNFGGNEDDLNPILKHGTSAYMLVYIRESCIRTVLHEVHEDHIPQKLIDQLQEKKSIEMIQRKDQNEDDLYMCIEVVLEDAFNGHQGNGLFDPLKVNYQSFRVKKAATLQEFLQQFADMQKYPVEQLRPWPLNFLNQPTLLDLERELHKPLIEINNSNLWRVFIEMFPLDSGLRALQTYDKDTDSLVFFKYYDPIHKRLHYCGHHYIPISFKFQELVSLLNERGGLSQGTELALFEEMQSNLLKRILDLDNELTDGDIIVFQHADLLDEPSLELPSCCDYFRDLSYKVEVTFCDKTMSSDPGFKMKLSKRMNYDQMSKAVAQKLGTDPYLLQFFRSQSYGPGNPVRCTYFGMLKDLLVWVKSRQPKKIYYQQLSIRKNELEIKKQFKCMWLDNGMKEEQELVLYPNKNGTVADLLHEARKQVTMSENGSAKLRLVEICSYKIASVPGESVTLDALSTAESLSYRIEEIPLEELHSADDELLIPVAHFHKEIFSTFGIPFLFKVKQGELFSHVRNRIQKRLDVPEKAFEKYRFAIVMMGRPTFITDDDHVNLSDFKPYPTQMSLPVKPWMGVEHINKAPNKEIKRLSQNNPTMAKDNFLKINGLIKSMNKKGEVCHYGNRGFAILHEDPTQDCEENYSVLGYVSSGLDIVRKIAEDHTEQQKQPIQPACYGSAVNRFSKQHPYAVTRKYQEEDIFEYAEALPQLLPKPPKDKISNILPNQRSPIFNIAIKEVGVVVNPYS